MFDAILQKKLNEQSHATSNFGIEFSNHINIFILKDDVTKLRRFYFVSSSFFLLSSLYLAKNAFKSSSQDYLKTPDQTAIWQFGLVF